jgi:hypothetical protein
MEGQELPMDMVRQFTILFPPAKCACVLVLWQLVLHNSNAVYAVCWRRCGASRRAAPVGIERMRRVWLDMSSARSAVVFALASVILDGRYCRGHCSGFELVYVHQVGLADDGFPLRHAI